MYKKREGLVCEQIDEEIIIFDTISEQFYEFEGIGSTVWNYLDKNTFDDIINLVCSRYAVDRNTAISDTQEFIDSLIEENLIDKDEYTK
jgi:hypothetical protein